MSLIEELNVQAALEAQRGGEELVLESLVERQLLQVIVHELLTMELWRAEVLPRILKRGKPESSFQVWLSYEDLLLATFIKICALPQNIAQNCFI
jgi:hypothetical protein